MTEEQRYFNSPEHWAEITRVIKRFMEEPMPEEKQPAQTRITATVIQMEPVIQLKIDGDVVELKKSDAHRVMCALMGVLGFSEDFLLKRGYQPKEALAILKTFWDGAP